MDKVKIMESLIKILSCAMQDREIDFLDLSEEEWEELFEEAKSHVVSSILYPVINRQKDKQLIPSELLGTWRRSTLAASSRQIRNHMLLRQTIDAVRDAGIIILVFKGIILSRLYSNPESRITADSDLLILAEDLEPVHDKLLSLGFRFEEKSPASPVKHYCREELHLELHLRLFDGEGSSQDDANFDALSIRSRRISVKVDGFAFDTFSHDDHLYYLILHMAKHFIAAGFGLRHLTDLTVFVRAYENQIDWDLLFSRLQRKGMTVFALNLFEICRQWFDLAIHAPAYERALRDTPPDPVHLMEDIMDAGVFGLRTETRRISRSITGRVHKQKASHFGLFIKSVFPGVFYLENQYGYLKKRKWLLPVAWLHRLGSFLRVHLRNRNMREAFDGSAKLSHKRLALLREYRLID